MPLKDAGLPEKNKKRPEDPEGPELETFDDVLDILKEDQEEGSEAPEKPRPILEDIRSTRRYTVPDHPIFIGRDKKSSICILEESISRKHAKVFEKDGLCYIQDMGTINGTYLNDKRVLDPVELKDGDRIKIAITKRQPHGAREFLFRMKVAEEVNKQNQEEQERNDVLKGAGVASGGKTEADRKKILLRHCIFKIARQNLVSMLMTETPRRVALTKLDLGRKILSFQCQTPLKPRDSLIVTVEHPRISDALKFSIRVGNVTAKADYGVYDHVTEIVKISDKHKEIFDGNIKISPLICYVTSTLQKE